MATAVVAEPVALHEPQAKESSDTSHAQQQHEKALRFQEQPWASTQRVSLLTGAERDATIAQDISQLIGNGDTMIQCYGSAHILLLCQRGCTRRELPGWQPNRSITSCYAHVCPRYRSGQVLAGNAFHQDLDRYFVTVS